MSDGFVKSFAAVFCTNYRRSTAVSLRHVRKELCYFNGQELIVGKMSCNMKFKVLVKKF